MTMTREQAMFPSPYGDCGSYRLMKKDDIKPGLTSFRPLTGIVVLINIVAMELMFPTQVVSVPLRGLWFLSSKMRTATISSILEFPSPYGDCGSYQIKRKFKKVLDKRCFRPLTGIVVLITDKKTAKRLLGIASFRPLTGIVVLIRCSAVSVD